MAHGQGRTGAEGRRLAARAPQNLSERMRAVEGCLVPYLKSTESRVGWRMRAVEGCMLSVIIMPLVPSTSARWSYPYGAWSHTSRVSNPAWVQPPWAVRYGAWRHTSMIASLPFAKRTMTLAVSNACQSHEAELAGAHD